MNTRHVFLKKGNNVFIEDKFIQNFSTFNEAWTFASQLSQLIESTGIESICYTQGGTWILDDESNDETKYTSDDIPF